MLSRRMIVLCVILGVLIIGWLSWRGISSRRQPVEAAAPIIDKQRVAFTTRTFDPAAPPSDMPPLSLGENAECDSNFLSNASVGGESRQTDASHALFTITKINVTLQLAVTIWVPGGAAQRVIDHEDGHRKVSEYYYEGADKIAARIAATYMGKQIEISGSDLAAESGKMLRQIAGDITEQYNRELNPGPTQLLYDSITDHGRNDVIVKDAVTAAIKNVTVAWFRPVKRGEKHSRRSPLFFFELV